MMGAIDQIEEHHRELDEALQEISDEDVTFKCFTIVSSNDQPSGQMVIGPEEFGPDKVIQYLEACIQGLKDGQMRDRRSLEKGGMN